MPEVNTTGVTFSSTIVILELVIMKYVHGIHLQESICRVPHHVKFIHLNSPNRLGRLLAVLIVDRFIRPPRRESAHAILRRNCKRQIQTL